MGYRDIYKESNEQAEERFSLVMERIAEIAEETDVPEKFDDYFKKTAAFLLQLKNVSEKAEKDTLKDASLTECEKQNAGFYDDIKAENYGKSYGNPTYAVEKLGEEYGQILSALYAECRKRITDVYAAKKMNVTITAELFVEIYNYFEDKEGIDKTAIEQAIYWYFHDYSEIFIGDSVRELVDSEEDFLYQIVMNSDLNDLRYLYQYGQHIGKNETGIAAFLNGMSDEEIQAMADTYTEGYRIGFAATGKDLSKKTTAQVRYPIGFERMVRAAVKNLEKLNLKVTMRACSSAANKQYDYDHKEDKALYYDKAYVERRLEVMKTSFEEMKKLANGQAGPAVIEVFGEIPFSPETKKEVLKLDEKQQQLSVYDMSMSGQITNQYIIGEERSFTIIAYPVPEIGEKFEEIFAETVKINTLDYKKYQKIQQTIIDTLDTCEWVEIKGKGENETDLLIHLHTLTDAKTQTNFENCVADVNIPVGEVFTSPQLAGTGGILHVKKVYLNGLQFRDLKLVFDCGQVIDYSCSNFETEEENRKYIEDNILFHHPKLAMGEFAIGTNTTAYVAAQKYNIADKLPILIAEKMGPHFAVGDTCYSWSEDTPVYNPDGKEIIARDNEISEMRKEDVSLAYYGCHTDITIPYDELGSIRTIDDEGDMISIIEDGRFVLPGTEALNEPFGE